MEIKYDVPHVLGSVESEFEGEVVSFNVVFPLAPFVGVENVRVVNKPRRADEHVGQSLKETIVGVLHYLKELWSDGYFGLILLFPGLWFPQSHIHPERLIYILNK